MLVWKAMPSMVPMMSEIFLLATLISSMVVTTWPTTSPPRVAAATADCTSWLAVRADSAVWRTVPVSSLIDDAAFCRLLAVCSVRWLRSRLPVAISELAVPMLSTELRTVPMVEASRWRMRSVSWMSAPISSLRLLLTLTLRSPSAMAPTAVCSEDSGWATRLRIIQNSPTPRPAAVSARALQKNQRVARPAACASLRETWATTQ